MIRIVLLLAVFFVAISCTRAPEVGGAVASAHPLATKAGIRILENGGNAFDAAVAIAATLNVVEPMNSGIGGYGTILVFDASTSKIRYLNASGRMPLATNSDLMRAGTDNYIQNRKGAMAVSTPGNLNAWNALHEAYGDKPWNELFEDAILHADSGYTITKGLSLAIASHFDQFSDYSKAIYGRQGVPRSEGDTLKQADLAKTLRLIATKGITEFYNGAIARIIDQTMTEKKGFLHASDLKQDKAEWFDPISIDYRGYQIFTAAPPSNAFAGLIGLRMMDVSRMDTIQSNIRYSRLLYQVCKKLYQARVQFSGFEENTPNLDSLFSTPVIENLLISSTQQSKSSESINTTHFVVTDKWGNIVCATQTLGEWFGSKIMPEGTGFWLNNSLAYCTYEPKGNPMDAFPGKYKMSGDCPVIIMKNGVPVVALGTPGGHTITQNLPQIIANYIDRKMTLQSAIDAPKISYIEPDRVLLDSGIAPAIANEFKTSGLNVRLGSIGNATGIEFIYGCNSRPSALHGAADRRGEGLFLTTIGEK